MPPLTYSVGAKCVCESNRICLCAKQGVTLRNTECSTRLCRTWSCITTLLSFPAHAAYTALRQPLRPGRQTMPSVELLRFAVLIRIELGALFRQESPPLGRLVQVGSSGDSVNAVRPCGQMLCAVLMIRVLEQPCAQKSAWPALPGPPPCCARPVDAAHAGISVRRVLAVGIHLVPLGIPSERAKANRH